MTDAFKDCPPIDKSLFYQFRYSNKQELVKLILINATHRRTYQYFLLSKKDMDFNKSFVLVFSFIVKANSDCTKSWLSEVKFLVPD